MKPKIIIADDSQTIQKVVKIYISKLEEDPSFKFDLELVECVDEKNLSSLVEEHKPSLILLDFNLSENKTGYDLSKELKEIHPAKMLMMYGTFDTVDESLFFDSGINNFVVKPFDGVKFVNLIQSLLEENSLGSDDDVEVTTDDEIEVEVQSETETTTDDVEVELDEDDLEDEYVSDSIVSVAEEEPLGDETILDESVESVEIDEDWVVQQPHVDHDVELKTNEVVTNEEISTLEKGMEDWGIDIPPVIEGSDSKMELPPVISESHEEEEVDQVVSDESAEKFPSEDDLAYPDEIEMLGGPALTPISELKPTEGDDNQKEEFTITEIGLDDTLGTNTIEEVRALEEQISDEVEITSTYKLNDIWNSDEVEQESESYTEPQQDTEFDINQFKADDDYEQDHIDKEQTEELVPASNHHAENHIPQKVEAIEISEDLITAKVEEVLAPMVDKIVREKVDSILEKVSWEVIPDLAENLIRQELKTITDQVLES